MTYSCLSPVLSFHVSYSSHQPIFLWSTYQLRNLTDIWWTCLVAACFKSRRQCIVLVGSCHFLGLMLRVERCSTALACQMVWNLLDLRAKSSLGQSCTIRILKQLLHVSSHTLFLSDMHFCIHTRMKLLV